MCPQELKSCPTPLKVRTHHWVKAGLGMGNEVCDCTDNLFS
jgi:hypothetical protein